jgi:hypothetical protein
VEVEAMRIRRGSRRSPTAVLLALVALVLLAGPAGGAFLAATANGGNGWAAAVSFPDYPTQVLRSGPGSYFRAETDAPSSASTSKALDSSVNAVDGTYAAQTNGPSTWWRLDEASGVTSSADSSGAANQASRVGGATSGSGMHGNAVFLDGVDDRVYGDRPSVRTDLSWTATAWVRLEHKSSSQYSLSQDGIYQSAFGLGYTTSSDRWAVYVANSDTVNASYGILSGTTVPPLNTWTHLAAVYTPGATSGTLRLYVNGALESSASYTTSWIAVGSLAAGRIIYNGGGTARWTGGIDDARTYRRALSGTEVSSLYTRVPGSNEAGMTTGLRGALLGPQKNLDGGYAVAFAGTSNLYSPTTFTGPSTFSLELWFRVSGTLGGHLIGFASAPSGSTTYSDRMVFVDSGGRLSFVTKGTSTLHVVRSPAAYNDGTWHHMVATMSPTTGMRLYVDGMLVGSLASASNVDNYTGYWRAGGSKVVGWPNDPASQYLIGTLDEVAVYQKVLTDSEISAHYEADY